MTKAAKIHKAYADRIQRKKEKACSTDRKRAISSGQSQSQNLLQWETERGPIDPTLMNLKWILTRDVYECDRIVSFLQSKMEEKRFIGLDIEYDPCFRKGQITKTALLQIGVHTGHCLLLQVNRMKSLPQGLVKLLTDPTVLKLGVGIQDDVVKIRRDFNIQVQGAFDLRSIAPPSKKCGLAALAQDHLNATISKSKKIVLSKWSDELSPQKQAYAAKDAYVAVLLVQKLVAKELRISEDRVNPNDIFTVKKNFAERTNNPNGARR